MNWRRTSGTFSIMGLAAVGGLLHAGCHPPAVNSEQDAPVTAPEETPETPENEPAEPKPS
ncbi:MULTISPECIES: hypothetical protein [Pirellulaceae]|uniref:hypothetical protein n=1 Tax=Pirellulaceae TaxID=2691357 RepID=UPI0011B0D148|nr:MULTISPECIES: hypothetical protein [Pirellulaceae]